MNGSLRATSFLAVKKNFFLHVDVKERTKSSVVFSSVTKENHGGPDRTRTYDPRLIKAVL